MNMNDKLKIYDAVIVTLIFLLAVCFIFLLNAYTNKCEYSKAQDEVIEMVEQEDSTFFDTLGETDTYQDYKILKNNN